jgi:hypothetical protein
MAKLNYQKLAVQQQHDRNRSRTNKHESAKKFEKIWMLGTHYGKKLHELPLQYLIWVSETFKENDYHKLKADAELIRRHTKLIKAQ